MPYVMPNDGEVVGVGQPIAVRFDENITDRLAAQWAITVTASPAVEGAFYWLSNERTLVIADDGLCSTDQVRSSIGLAAVGGASLIPP